jgi:hypothetical protein
MGDVELSMCESAEGSFKTKSFQDTLSVGPDRVNK